MKKNWGELIESEKLDLVEFMLPTCEACQKMEPVVKDLAEDYDEEVSIYQVNVKNHKKLAIQNGVKNTPAFKLFCQGEPISTKTGEVYPKVLERMIEEGIEYGEECAQKRTDVGDVLNGTCRYWL